VALYLAAKAFGDRGPKHRDACHVGSHVLATLLHLTVIATLDGL
jgi:hypothetical protein